MFPSHDHARNDAQKVNASLTLDTLCSVYAGILSYRASRLKTESDEACDAAQKLVGIEGKHLSAFIGA